ncbi:MAG: HAD hydrolase-like protein, partial [Acidimicrobiales bacterium]
LDELRRRGAECGLLTGNSRKIAYLKMSATGLGSVFRFGGFGDEGDQRTDLFSRAIDEARALGALGAGGVRICYVGDTPLDIHAARLAGVPMVAVATGRFGRADLETAGAETVVEAYGRTGEVCDVLLDRARMPRPTSAGDNRP